MFLGLSCSQCHVFAAPAKQEILGFPENFFLIFDNSANLGDPAVDVGKTVRCQRFHQHTGASPKLIQGKAVAGCGWHMPVILATQEAEIRRIEVRSQSQGNSS
jgi:hypothetical protein